MRERDPASGYETTGHEWNGIRELNSPVPRPVYIFLIAAVLFSVVYWILLPAWPLGRSYTKGLLGIDQRASVERAIAEARSERAAWTDLLERTPVEDALADPTLMARVREEAGVLFADNCAACHGRDGKGAPGFPNLRDDVWLWGGSPEAVAETIRVGVSSGHPESRISQMPAFGRDQMLPQDDVLAAAAHVRWLSRGGPAAHEADPRGVEVFARTCAACHGADGKGRQDVGAPDLTDGDWLYGGDPDTILQSVWRGRQGQMPAWEARLSSAERRMLVLYLLDGAEERE